MSETTDWTFGGTWPYTPAKHIENLSVLLGDLDLHDVTLVMQDWGGPIGFGYAVENVERVKRLVILNTWPSSSPKACSSRRCSNSSAGLGSARRWCSD